MTGQLAAQRTRADGRLQPDRRAAPLHRGGAVRRVGRRDRARRGRAASSCRTGRRASCWACDLMARDRRAAGRRGAGVRAAARRGARRSRSGRAPPRSRSAAPPRRRTLLVRIGAELRGGRPDGFVVTFDDITELQSAQRKAAWADVARRIAHEIKNPLTPIQLSRRAAEAALRQGDHLRPRDLRAMRRHHRPPCRRYRPHGRRVLRLRPHAAAGDAARGCRPDRARGAGPAAQRAAGDRLDDRHPGARPDGACATAGCSARR